MTNDGLLHAPDRRLANFMAWYEMRRNSHGITWGVPSIDSRVIPMYPGDLVGFMGRPGHAKTSLMAFLVKREAMRAKDDECVVYVAWEGSAEEIEAYMLASDKIPLSDLAWGRVSPEEILGAASANAMLPIYVIAHSVIEETSGYMTPQTVFEKVQHIQEQTGRRVRLVALDYIQIMELDDFKALDRTQRIIEATVRAKYMAKRLSVPVVMGIQAHRRVDDRDPPIPTARDAEYSSAIEQNCDKLFGLWRPIKTMKLGDEVLIGGRSYPLADTLLVMRMLKQRLESAVGTWPLYFNPATLVLQEMLPNGR